MDALAMRDVLFSYWAAEYNTSKSHAYLITGKAGTAWAQLISSGH